MKPQIPAPAAAGKGFWLLLGAGLLLAGALLAVRASRPAARDAALASGLPDPGVSPEPQATADTNPPKAKATDHPGSPTTSAYVPVPQIPAHEMPAPSAESRKLVNSVCHLDPTAGPITAERATRWKQDFEQLVQGGASSVPAIAEFIKLNQDWAFGVGDAELLGYNSPRAAMMDALSQIGGAEGISVLGEILQTTAVPREIALLARNLEALAPEQYRVHAVEAARQTLAMAVEKHLEDFDVAPLFEVLQKYGGPGIVNDLEHATFQWNYYAALALGNLPDGAGVPSLIRMAALGPGNEPNPGRLQALQMLAQLATSNPDARAALVEQARANQIGPNLWPYLSRPLSGDQAHVRDSVLNENLSSLARANTGSSHINHNNQNLFYAPIGGGLTADQAGEQLRLVSELTAAVTNPEALRVLQQTRTLLDQRLAIANTAMIGPP